MNKIKATFILIALVGVCSAFITNVESSGREAKKRILYKKYVALASVNGKTYLQNSPYSSMQPYLLPDSWQEGDQYECLADDAVCTVTVLSILSPLYDPNAGLYYFLNINILQCSYGYFFKYEY